MTLGSTHGNATRKNMREILHRKNRIELGTEEIKWSEKKKVIKGNPQVLNLGNYKDVITEWEQ